MIALPKPVHLRMAVIFIPRPVTGKTSAWTVYMFLLGCCNSVDVSQLWHTPLGKRGCLMGMADSQVTCLPCACEVQAV